MSDNDGLATRFVPLKSLRTLIPVGEAILADARKAVEALEKVGEKMNALTDVIAIAQSMGRIDDLVAYCYPLLDDPLWSQHRAHILVRLADVCFEGSRFDQALGYYLQCAEIEVDNDNLRHHRLEAAAFCCLMKGDPLQALDHSKAAIVINPEHWHAWRHLGMCYEALDDPREAANCYARAIKLSDGNVIPIVHLRELVKRRESAIPHLQKIRHELSERLGVLV